VDAASANGARDGFVDGRSPAKECVAQVGIQTGVAFFAGVQVLLWGADTLSRKLNDERSAIRVFDFAFG
jgi:hypothetical protein